MPSGPDLDARLVALSAEIDAWTRQFVQRSRPAADPFAALLAYPLGWVDPDLQPLADPTVAGKRLRPALCLLICEALAGDHRPALAPAAAVELVHNFSLVHDDIQDESPLRRGRPSVWQRWGTAQAINIGDALFALAQLALTDPSSVPPILVAEAITQLNRTCLRLVEGQYLDLALQTGGGATFEAYQSMIEGKTAALIECAAHLGARYGGADPTRAARFAAFGHQLGIAFQLQDDVLGVWGDPALTGKSADTDLQTRKQALPAILALRRTGPDADRFRRIFLARDEMTAEQASTAVGLLDALGIRAEAEQLVETAYDRADASLSAALQDSAHTALRVLLDRFRRRVA